MNRTERIIITMVLTLCALLSVLVILLLSLPYLRGASPTVVTRHYPAFLETLPLRLFSTIIHALVLLASGASISLLIRKSNYPEFTFYIFGLLSYAGIGILHGAPLIIIAGGAVPSAAVLLRLFYFFWMFGTICFFIAGLFPNGMPNLKQQILFFTALVSSAAVVTTVPIDIHNLLGKFPYTYSWEGTLSLFIRGFSVLAVCNFLAAGSRTSSPRFFAAGGGILLILAGNELFFMLTTFTALLSILLFIAGTILFGFMMYREYMWS